MTVLEAVAAASTLIALVGGLFGLQGERWAELLIWWFGLTMAALFVALFLNQWQTGRLLSRARRRYERRARFAEASRSLHEAHQQLRDALHLLREGGAYASSYHAALTAVARSYSIISGADCRASLKRLGYDVDEPSIEDVHVTTFGRSVRSASSSRHDHQKDRVAANTDFSVLFEDPDREWWFANDLTTLTPYANSHWDERTVLEQSYDYTATMVWPVRRAWREPDGTPQHDLLGYLCVDALVKDPFARPTDFGFGASVAEHLYAFLSELRRQEATVEEAPPDPGAPPAPPAFEGPLSEFQQPDVP